VGGLSAVFYASAATGLGRMRPRQHLHPMADGCGRKWGGRVKGAGRRPQSYGHIRARCGRHFSSSAMKSRANPSSSHTLLSLQKKDTAKKRAAADLTTNVVPTPWGCFLDACLCQRLNKLSNRGREACSIESSGEPLTTDRLSTTLFDAVWVGLVPEP